MKASSPLAGIRVLDLSAYIAGPYGCSLLADLGAEVFKIEPPSGDTLRQYPSTLENESRAFLGTNRSKLGLVLDLKRPQGQQVQHETELAFTSIRKALGQLQKDSKVTLAKDGKTWSLAAAE